MPEGYIEKYVGPAMLTPNIYLLFSTVQKQAVEQRGVLHRDCSINNTMIEDTPNGPRGFFLDWEFAVQINMQHTYEIGGTVCLLLPLLIARLTVTFTGYPTISVDIPPRPAEGFFSTHRIFIHPEKCVPHSR